MTTQGENPCQPCGACCNNFRVSFYHGELDDMPFGWVPVHLVEKLSESRACMKGTSQKNPLCVALTGTPGVATSCSIYEHRPTPCREFEPWEADGSPNERCQSLRVKLGLSALQHRLASLPAQEAKPALS